MQSTWLGVYFSPAAFPFCLLVPAIFRQGLVVLPFFIGLIAQFARLITLGFQTLEQNFQTKFRFEPILTGVVLALLLIIPSPRGSLATRVRYNRVEESFRKNLVKHCKKISPDSLVLTTIGFDFPNFVCAKQNIQFIQVF